MWKRWRTQCFQEYDFEIQVLANNFEEFIGMLISLEELEKEKPSLSAISKWRFNTSK
ncbi:hypothetical protein [Granulicatella elegans]|uniref:hypothetical protein n=1 Tax=Granulicatella elegans TaxID=137732 RepID=UPI001D135EEB|nr:hypothetical protein [Granulicatella elegans]UEA31210.1 hypothetical protein LK443_08080 [Granulicatella elegans]